MGFCRVAYGALWGFSMGFYMGFLRGCIEMPYTAL